MTLRLILMRHAKSSWDHPGLSDHDRPLNGRGKRAARAIGDWLRKCDYIPDQTLSSTAQRTRETNALLGLDTVAQFTPRLYHAEPQTMLDVLKGAAGQSVLMIGHNPGIAWLAEGLVSSPPAHPRFHDYPTGATLVAEFSGDTWNAISPGTATVLDFITPRELTG